MKPAKNSESVVFAAFSANIFIAAVKFLVAWVTASSAILAEAVHSSADTLNQILLFIGIKKAAKKADELHPFGFSGEAYFWSFIVAIILFTSGAFFSIYEGVRKLRHPAPVDHILYAFLVLGIAMVAEALSLRVAFKKINVERGRTGIIAYLRKSKKAELIVVFMEDTAALVGLTIALAALLLEHFTGILFFDGLASILIGVLLACTAMFIGNETRSLLIGEGADPEMLRKIRLLLLKEDSIQRVIHIRSLHLGAEDILLAVKAEFDEHLNTEQICVVINGLEKDIRSQFPEVNKIFIEPDMFRRR
ncbi:MAG: cation diffusion facilitator family transporter [Candidatus Aminicenantes bacterium]|nr:cation diffusion facilitator family transporter [Candidatus Aminicenantes bacterium]